MILSESEKYGFVGVILVGVFFVVVVPSLHPALCFVLRPLPSTCISPSISVFIFISVSYWVWHSFTSHVSLHPSVLCALLIPSPACIIIAEVLRNNNSVFI